MNTNTAAANLRNRIGASPFERPASTLARGLVDRDNNLVLDGDALGRATLVGATLTASPIPKCVKINVPLASLVAMGAVTSGNISLGFLPARSIVSQSVVKHNTALTGGSAKATGTLTSDNTAPSDGDTVVIGNKTYTFKTSLTPTEGEVLINSTADAALLNLIRAINHTGTANTDYKCAAAHTQVTAASSVTSHAFAVTAITAGTGGNAIATTEGSSHLSWGAVTLTGGGAVTLTAATARLTTANTNYGSAALDVFQAVANAAQTFHDTPPKKENFSTTTELLLAMVFTAANADTLLTGSIDVWVLYYSLG